MKPDKLPEIEDLKKARKRIQEIVNYTPVMTSRTLNRITGSNLYFKCENFQRCGAFKFRGASNAIQCLMEKGPVSAVATHSSGNHAGALALAARQSGIKCYVVMPENAPQIKIDAVRGYGAEIIFCAPTLKAREEGINKLMEEKLVHFIHPYNDFNIISGQGTAMLELAEQIPSPDCIIAPVGGGGLMSGTAIAAASLFPNCKIYGAEPKGADDAWRSLKEGKIIPSVNPTTMADGLLTSLGALTFEILSQKLDDILTVSEESILEAMKLIWYRMKLVAEPSACVPLAAVIEHPELFRNKTTGLIISGGNVELKTIYGLINKLQVTG